MKKALITGITGQDGSYLAELLLSKGYEIPTLIKFSAGAQIPAGKWNEWLKSQFKMREKSGLCLGLAQPRNSLAFLPITTLLQDLQALKALQYVPLAAQSGSCPQTPML